MNFQASNLDAAYDTLSSLNTLASTNGQNLVNNLKSLTIRLKNDWKGNDAMVHINNLIDVYTGVATIVENVHIIAHNASGPIVQAQEIRNSNGGVGNVGSVIVPGNSAFETLEKLGTTTEYFVDPAAAPQDLTTLTAEKGAFERFATEFTRLKDELLNNWTSGLNREKAVADFEQFEADIAKYKSIFEDAEANLTIAVNNLKQL